MKILKFKQSNSSRPVLVFEGPDFGLRRRGLLGTLAEASYLSTGRDVFDQNEVGDATRKVNNNQFSKMCSAVEPQATFKFEVSNSFQQKLLLGIWL